VRNSALPTPILQPRLQHQDYQFEVRLPAGSWRWTTRVDVSKAVPTFEVRDIVSPYGLLRDSVPIPGSVIQEMAESITQLTQSFAPSILLSPLTLVFTVDEGRGWSPSQEVMLTNNGVFGSLLSSSITSSVPWVTATPANVGGLAANESGKFQVAVDSGSLLAGIYAADLTVQDPTAGNSPQVIPVTINVRSKPLIATSTPTLNFSVTKPVTGPFPPVPTQTFQLSNSGLPDSLLEYQIQKLTGVNWLVSYTPVFGVIQGGTAQTITVVVAPPEGMFAGTYEETLRITGYSSNYQVDVKVTLTVT